jgi:hypothetical protein
VTADRVRLKPFLLVHWLQRATRAGAATSEALADALDAFVAAVSPLPSAPAWAAYRLTEAGAVTRQRGRAAHHPELPYHMEMDAPDAPELFTVTGFDEFDAACGAHATLTATLDADSIRQLASGLYREVRTWSARTEAAGRPGEYRDMVHFGTYDTRSPGDEWALARFYAEKRMPEFVAAAGTLRARRLVNVCGAPARTAVLYEFESSQARLDHFEPLEGEPVAAAAQSLTIHPRLSPSIGVRLASGDGV